MSFATPLSGMNAAQDWAAATNDNVVNSENNAYKKNNIQFHNIVNDENARTGYQSGAVAAVNRRLIDKKGGFQATGNALDLTVTGSGMIPVNSKTDGSGDNLFTRALSFQPNNEGVLLNTARMALMAWPLDNEGRRPGESGNQNTVANSLLESLVPVNIRDIGGAASATTKVNLGIRLDSRETVLQGPGQTIDLSKSNGANKSISFDDVIVPGNTFVVGDNISIRTQSNEYVFTYGGFSRSNDINATPVYGASTSSAKFSSGITEGHSFKITVDSSSYTFTYVPNNPDIAKGEFNSLANLSEAIDMIKGLTSRIYSNRLYVAPVDANDAMTFTDISGTIAADLGLFNTSAPLLSVQGGTSGATHEGDTVFSNNITNGTGILGATTAIADMATATIGDRLEITLPAVNGYAAVGPLTLTKAAALNAAAAEFSSLADIATIINSNPTFNVHMNAQVYNNRLYISPLAPGRTMSFTSPDVTQFHTAMGLIDSTIVVPNKEVKRFASLEGLAGLVKETDELDYSVSATSGTNSLLTIYNKDPLSTLRFTNTNSLPSNSLLDEFALTRNPAQLVAEDPGIAANGPAYDPSDANKNIASGSILADHSASFRVIDPLGEGHDFKVSFVKLDVNTWGAELYASNPEDLAVGSRADGLIGYGTITFNGDGTLQSVSSSLLQSINIAWSNGALDNDITFAWGTAGVPKNVSNGQQIGDTDGMSQFAAEYDNNIIEPNGASVALLNNISVDNEGFVIANYRNGLSTKIYQIPVASFSNYNGLTPLDGNVYAQNYQSGNFNLRVAGTGGVGEISSGGLELSNVEIAEELTNLVRAQRLFESSSQAMNIQNSMLDELKRIFA